ncbi:hypothetical protein GBA52_014239 [Prunus armeniaca]|nr:hypothetical protein GBA52_014239 [Prunus armeniaca]
MVKTLKLSVMVLLALAMAATSLVFKFEAGEQDLAFVTKEYLGSCDTADPLHVFEKPTTIKFLGADTFYVTSTLAGHCSKGQKMTFDISPSSTFSTSPSPSADQESQLPLNFVTQISGIGF